ncbi:MAG: hypothetical protein HYY16_02575 [Planctomycetes bacterium]|nr:hypothetical protein [Planctomycetota bacterium]
MLPAFALAIAATAFAQAPVTAQKDKAETVKITLGGTGDVDFIHRNAAISDWRTATLGDNDDTATIAPNIWTRLDVELADKVSGVGEMGLDPLNNPTLGSDVRTPTFGQLYLQLAEAFDPNVTVRLGQVWTEFDVRGRGGSIILDSFWSEAIDTTTAAGFTSIDQINDGRSLAFDYGFSAGAVVDYKRDNLSVQLALLPRKNDGAGNTHPGDVESIYAAMVFINLDTVGPGSRAGILLSSFGVPGNETVVYTLGGGVDLHGMVENLEMYAEIYAQFGDGGVFDPVPPSTEGPGTVDMGGFAWQAGAHYTFVADVKPWVEGKFTWLSGDDDTNDTDNDAFVSYEHQRDLLILEDEVFGVDWDSNYFAIKVLGGVSFTTGGGIPNNLQVSGAFGMARANEDLQLGTPPSGEDALGNEVDVKVKWLYSKAVNMTAGMAFLFGSDIMEGQTDDAAGNPGAKDDSGWLFTIGSDVTW